MGEYADLQIREDTKRMFGFDPGPTDDEPRRKQAKPVYKRVKCPHCDAKPKEAGLQQHIRDVHQVSQSKMAENSHP
jgi:hypothetical protein